MPPSGCSTSTNIILSTFRWGRLISPEVLTVCLDRQLLTIEGFYCLNKNDEALSILHWTIATGNVPLTLTVLQKYLDDSFGFCSRADAMFRIAVWSNNVDTVQVLLDHGFDPEGGNCGMRDKSTFELARRGCLSPGLRDSLGEEVGRRGRVLHA
ncbi:uncharacterized protein K460DRAFT_48135 [Cucurbitaria berberidis CBS 394.84]|uniref:Ankyrin n=1 Tax=Cucurbitaria berberidis CBS 394.84 TaxID=1168544 RepID=A0A9P4GV83_9PLEO|nr:uncharacterized protein K460DRAFT_48135 [Cucurbitaria berberidis CBS 394.84]KAF1852181.1 hypothetical protein K460DRAFT_48135 [Cucurbitaria berberidis CBS 394.84]